MVETENNAMTITTADGATRPAWGASYDLSTNIATPMSVTSNTFCAGGFSLADGRWAVFGGNQPVTTNGSAVKDQPDKANPYGNTDGGEAIRLLTPCDGGGCEYQEGGDALTMTVSKPLHHCEGEDRERKRLMSVGKEVVSYYRRFGRRVGHCHWW